jgi:hypothetical protein
MKIGVGANSLRQLNLTDSNNIGKNHDHALQIDPTLFIHSATDPDIDNTQWVSLYHNKTSTYFTSGKGFIMCNPGITIIDYGRITMGGTSGGSILYYDPTMLQQPFFLGSVHRNLVIGDVATGLGKNFDHALSANPTLFIHSVTDPDVNNTQWVSLTHNQTNGVIATGLGDIILDPISEITEVCGVGLKTKEYNATVNDDVKIALPASTTGWGTVMIGDNQEFARFRWTSQAVVTLDESTANVIASDTDLYLCIFDDGLNVSIRNRLGANLVVRYVIHYS